LFILIALACSPPPNDDSEMWFTSQTGADTDSDADTDADTDTDTDTDSDSDTDTDADTDTGPIFDCKLGLPPDLPYDSRKIVGSVTAEDIDIDVDGYIVGSDRKNLYRSDVAGNLDVILPNVGNPQGIVVLPSGDIVFENEQSELLERLDTKGNRTTIATQIYVPFGDADALGRVYATAPDVASGHTTESQIIRIDPVAKTIEPLMDWDDNYPWGIAFSEDHRALYVSVVDGMAKPDPPRIWKLNLDEKGDIDGDPELFVEAFDGLEYWQWTEGLAVDVCGNVYASVGTKIFRVSKDGSARDVIWETESLGTWNRAISGLAFGRGGKGGTDPMKLYASNPYDKSAYEIDVGVYGASRW
jgi:hypothetical protein